TPTPDTAKKSAVQPPRQPDTWVAPIPKPPPARVPWPWRRRSAMRYVGVSARARRPRAPAGERARMAKVLSAALDLGAGRGLTARLAAGTSGWARAGVAAARTMDAARIDAQARAARRSMAGSRAWDVPRSTRAETARSRRRVCSRLHTPSSGLHAGGGEA